MSNKIKVLYKTLTNFLTQLSSEINDSPQEVKLSDGKMITITGSITEGNMVSIKNDKGEIMPIPDGSYRLGDGSLLRAENGIITEYVWSGNVIVDSSTSTTTTDDDKGADTEEKKEDEASTEETKNQTEEVTAKHKQNSTNNKNKMETNKENINDNSPAKDNAESAELTELTELKKLIENLNNQFKSVSEKLAAQELENTQLKKTVEKIGEQPGDKALFLTDQTENKTNDVPADPYDKDRFFNELAEERLVAMKKKKVITQK